MKSCEYSDDIRARALSLEPDHGLDLSGVDPLRREEVRRRVAVVRAFIALPAPNDADRREHADALSLSVNQFKALVRVWSEHPRASSVAGSGSSRGQHRHTGPRHLPTQVKDVLSEALASLPPRASLVAASKAVGTACAAAGIDPPSKATVHKMLVKARRGERSPQDAGIVVAGRCWVRLPTLSAQGIEMPRIALAVRAEDGAVIGATMSAEPQRHAAVATLGASMPGLIGLHLDEELVAGLPASAASIGTLTAPATIRRHLSRIVGDRFGEVRLVFKEGAQERPERLLRARKDAPLSRADAVAVVRAAISSWNAARGAPAAAWID